MANRTHVQTRQSCLIVQDKVYKQENVDVICTEDDKSNNNNLKLMFRLNGMEKISYNRQLFANNQKSIFLPRESWLPQGIA